MIAERGHRLSELRADYLHQFLDREKFQGILFLRTETRCSGFCAIFADKIAGYPITTQNSLYTAIVFTGC
jgi:hypothetical protein